MSKKITLKLTCLMLVLTPIFNFLANIQREQNFGPSGFGGECFLWIVPIVIYYFTNLDHEDSVKKWD